LLFKGIEIFKSIRTLRRAEASKSGGQGQFPTRVKFGFRLVDRRF